MKNILKKLEPLGEIKAVSLQEHNGTTDGYALVKRGGDYEGLWTVYFCIAVPAAEGPDLVEVSEHATQIKSGHAWDYYLNEIITAAGGC